MKNIALVTNILVLATTGVFAQSSTQNHSDFETLAARVSLTEAKINQLEVQLAQLKAKQAPQSQVAKLAATHNEQTVSSTSLSSYTVKKGDTLSRIAKNHSTSVTAIMKTNTLKSDRINIGQKLSIPSSMAKKTPAKAEPIAKATTSPTTTTKHVVKKGETFYSIAREHKVSLRSVIAANPSISPSKLREGQALVIDGNAKNAVVSNNTAPKKAAAPAPKTKEVAKKEPVQKSSSNIRTITVNEQMTYSQFASKHGASTKQLNSLNGLSLSSNTMLAKGSELYVPQY
ncbi:MAG: LysM peptidoglycan-binding domain-containing protein [Akkermansiaceae bacterium]